MSKLAARGGPGARGGAGGLPGMGGMPPLGPGGMPDLSKLSPSQLRAMQVRPVSPPPRFIPSLVEESADAGKPFCHAHSRCSRPVRAR